MTKPGYLKTARANEGIFRAILTDLRDHREERPGGVYVPEDLDVESDVNELFRKYSEGDRQGKFTVLDFERECGSVATISFQDVAPLSGGGTQLEYKINGDDSVEFLRQSGVWMSFA